MTMRDECPFSPAHTRMFHQLLPKIAKEFDGLPDFLRE